MILSVASGKGGTGKTTVAVNLALALGRSSRGSGVPPSNDGSSPRNDGHPPRGSGLPLREHGQPPRGSGLPPGIVLVDADVEEPNCHLFLRPRWKGRETITLPVPEVDLERCDYCGRCADVCAYSAITVIRDVVLLFPELCHGCGGCSLLCPRGAVAERPRPLGSVRWGRAEGLSFYHAELDPGQALAPPVTRALKARALGARGADLVIIDASPGTSCPAVEAVRGSDLCLLVTEPTPFGLSDLTLAVEMTAKLDVPTAVVINRADAGDDRVDRFCGERDLPVLARLPFDRRVAETYARGRPAVGAVPGWEERFRELGERALGLAAASRRRGEKRCRT
ncbi:MAG: ATP-binding protein [Bacillota bacterium]